MASSGTAAVLPLPAERFSRAAFFLLVLTSVSALVVTGKLDPITSLAAPAAVLYKGYRWWRRYPAELRQATATRLVLGYVFLFPFDAFFVSRALIPGGANEWLFATLLAAVHFLLFVMIVRLYSAQTDRDILFLAMLAFAGILAAAVFTIDTYFVAFFFLFLLFAVGAFVGLEIRRGASGAVFPLFYVQARRERRFHQALGLTALSLAVGAAVLGMVLFFVFPRFSAGYFAHAGTQATMLSGFSETVELGQIGEIKKNSAVVMRVRTGSAVNYPLLRWRGIAMEHFDGRRWSADPVSLRATYPASNDGWIHLLGPRQLERRPTLELRYTVLLEPAGSEVLFAPAQAVALRGNFTGEPGTYDSSARHSYLYRDGSGSVFNPFRNYSELRYEGISFLPVARPEEARYAGSEYPSGIRDAYLQLPPELDPRIEELARKVAGSASTALDQATAIETYLQRNFGYTLTLTGTPAKDPLAQFLFERKAGHCEYFASAMTVMLRTLGIPARMVNGFLPGEYNEVAGDYIVRGSDAHSWVEAYFPGSGWLTFDPTPPGSASRPGLFSKLALYMDWFQLNWNEWVVNYDFSHQLLLARNVRHNTGDWTESMRGRFRRWRDRGMDKLKSWQESHAWLRILFPVSLVALLVLLRFDWLRSFFRWAGLSWQMSRGATERNNPLLASRLYFELLVLLEKRGYKRRDGQTAREIAKSLVLQPQLAPSVQEFAKLYEQARFGGGACDAFRLRILLEQVRTAPRP